MKRNDLSKKVLLTVFVGGMLCANSALAEWYGKGNSFVITAPDPEVLTGVNAIIDDSTTIQGQTVGSANIIYGGYSNGSGTVTGNAITFSTTNAITISGAYIYGGYSNDGNATGNSMKISGGMFSDTWIYSGFSNNGNVMGNSVKIEGGIFECGVFNDGGFYCNFSDNGDVTDNSVTIESGTFSNIGFYCGFSNHCDTSGNSVTIEGGAFSNIGFYCGWSYGDAVSNSITIRGGTFSNDAKLYGGYSPINVVMCNSVTVENGTFNNNIELYGGHSASGTASKNEVTINNGNFTGSEIHGGRADYGMAVSENKVTINDGNFTGGAIYGGRNGAAVSGNEIIIKGGIFTNNIKLYGGFSDYGDAMSNSVTVEGGTFNGASLYGGKVDFGTITDNTLNLKTNVRGLVANVGNFQKVNFTIPAGVTSDIVMMQMADPSSSTFVLADVTDGFVVDLNGLSLAAGDYITLVKGVDDTSFTPLTNYYVLEFGGTKELVYANGMPTPKGDYTIRQNNGTVKGDSGIAGSYTGDIYGNTNGSGLTVTGGTLSATSYSGNEVIIRRGNYNIWLNGFCGAYVDTDAKINVDNNILEIFDATIVNTASTNFIVGGFNLSSGANEGDKGTVSYNQVLIHNLAINGTSITIAGGYMSKYQFREGKADGNLVKIDNLSAGTASVNVLGGFNIVGTVSNNIVELAAGKYNSVVGGMELEGNVIKNHVIIRGGDYDIETLAATMYCIVAGGLVVKNGGSANGNVEDNTVLIENGNFKGNIAGGYLAKNIVGYAKGNSVMIKDGTFAGSGYPAIYGGYADKGDVYENNVEIKGGNFIGNSWGIFEFYGGYGYTDNAVGTEKIYKNSVKVSGGSITQSRIYGGYGKGEVYENDVEITGGVFGQASTVTGGVSEIGGASRNTVDISNAAFAGGEAGDGVEISGGCVMGANDAIQNIVNIHSGSFGVEDVITIVAGVSDGGDAAGNKLNIEKGAFGDGTEFVGGTGVNATENEVNIFGGSFGNDIKLIGGCSNGGTSSNNTLNLKIKMSGKAAMIGYFQNMNFTLPAGIAKDDVMLKTATLFVDNNGGEATINVDAPNGVTLKAGNVITLIDSDSTTDNYLGGDILDGAADFYFEADVGEDRNGDGDYFDLIITLNRDFSSSGGEDEKKAPAEGIAAATQIVNMSADLASGEGMKSLLIETADGFTNTFGAFIKSQSKYKTGSHVDVDGWGVLVGAGNTKNWQDGSATAYGLFFEYGKGDFDTYNGNVHGDGNSENKGIGIMARHKLTNNTYYEGNIRFGKQETKWSQSELGGYDTDSRYYGISVGVGHIYPVGKNEIDVYGRYTYGHVGACDATLKDSKYHFDSVKSHRVRVGGKYNFKVKDSNAKPFIGLAWEHEFKGESKASISGVGEAPAPSMKGNTGILEVGCDWKVSKKWTVGLGANAYMGKRKGWDGMARVFYNF